MMIEKKRTISVVAAIIIEKGRVLVTQRGIGEWRGHWEFPGGKIEIGETPQEALRREIREELSLEIKVEALFSRVEYAYPTFHLSMQCYTCSLAGGNLSLIEHSASLWIGKEELDRLSWLPADLEVLPLLYRHLENLSSFSSELCGE